LYQSKQRGRDCVTVDGQTETVSTLRTTLMNYTFFTQPLVRVRDNQVLSSELLLRVYDGGEWHLPQNFDVTVPTMMDLIERAMHNMAVKSLCMNYELGELADPAIQDGLHSFTQRHPDLQNLVIELSALPDLQQMRRLAPIYRGFGVRFAIDSAGMPGVEQQFTPVLDDISLVKIPLQRLRPGADDQQIRQIIAHWQAICAAHHIYLLLEGIESEQDIVLAHEMGIEYGQGYYFSRPVLPRIV
jgi:EAL domain-containing protein (putative c-di-GMP-specific phosphodiesterase class I)